MFCGRGMQPCSLGQYRTPLPDAWQSDHCTEHMVLRSRLYADLVQAMAMMLPTLPQPACSGCTLDGKIAAVVGDEQNSGVSGATLPLDIASWKSPYT